MRKFISIFLAIMFFIGQNSISLADKAPDKVNFDKMNSNKVNFNKLDSNKANIDIGSKSAVLMDVGSKTVLYEKNCHEKLPPASVTKIMTMLLICENIEQGKIKLEDEVVISANASSMGGSQIYLEEGETQKVDTLLKAIAVASANDACVALAEHIGGSVEEFVVLMNNKAQELGMNDTNFVNTNGLPVENHYTSAYDIALMSRALLKHPMIEKYLTTWMDTVVVGKKHAEIGISNTNKLIKHYSGATGVKTGFTEEAKFCVSASAKRDKTHLIAVILHGETSKDRFNDAAKLLNYGFANYENVKICSKGEVLKSLELKKADTEKVDLVSDDDFEVLVKKGANKEFDKKIEIDENIRLPLKRGSKIGKVEVYSDNKLIGEVNLVTNKDINKPSYLEMLKRIVGNIF